jgi:hypothetical protein
LASEVQAYADIFLFDAQPSPPPPPFFYDDDKKKVLGALSFLVPK